jgi:adenosyl cobinamide kinase/adenosyl cobinamide phosphate guanylyltransferase
MIVLVIGGTRSGKSRLAERYAARLADAVTVIIPRDAPDATDAGFVARVEAHRARRPTSWTTVECGSDLPAALTRATGVALVDSLGTWLASVPDFSIDTHALCTALRARVGTTVVVSEEVGLAVHAATPVGRSFTDRLGALNTAVAAVADTVLFVVAGRVLPLETADSYFERT